jgi:hypothetical protein
VTKLFLLVLLLVGHLVHGQDKYPTKSQLIKSLTRQTKFDGKVYNSTNWFTIETDSSYRTTDTLLFYNNSRYQYGKHICNYIDWNFYKKDAFWVQYIELCKEPTTGTLVKDQTFFTYKLSDSKQRMFLSVFNKNVLVDEFEVLSLVKQPISSEDNETTEVLMLRRIKDGCGDH